MSNKKALISNYPFTFLLVLLSLPILLTSCADKSRPATPPVSNPVSIPVSPFVVIPAIAPAPLPPETAIDESRDLSCAYFYFLWGAHAESYKRYSEAQEAYEKALICDPDADYVLKKLPVLLIRMEKLHAAAQWLREAIKKNPNDLDNQLLLARLDVNIGDFNEAIEIYEKILELVFDNSIVCFCLGYFYS